MDPGRLERQIRKKIAKSKKHLKGSPLLGSAIYYTLKEGSRRHSDDELVRRVIEQLEKLHNEYVVTPGLRLTPTDMLLSEALIETVALEVEDLRVEGFSHTKPPFA